VIPSRLIHLFFPPRIPRRSARVRTRRRVSPILSRGALVGHGAAARPPWPNPCWPPPAPSPAAAPSRRATRSATSTRSKASWAIRCSPRWCSFERTANADPPDRHPGLPGLHRPGDWRAGGGRHGAGRDQCADRHRALDRTHVCTGRRTRPVPHDRDQQDRCRQRRPARPGRRHPERFGKQCLLLDLPCAMPSEVVELLGHDSGESDFTSVAAAHRALIDQIIEEDDSLMARYLEDGTDPTRGTARAVREGAARRPPGSDPVRLGAHRRGCAPVARRAGAPGAQPGRGESAAVLPRRARRATADLPGPPDAACTCWRMCSRWWWTRSSARWACSGCTRARCGGTPSCLSARPSGRSRWPTCTGCRARTMSRSTLVPGDIGAVAKVDEIAFDSVLHDSHDEDHIHLRPLEFPQPMQGLAVETRRKGDEQRLFEVLHKLELEDPCFRVERHPGSERDRDPRPGRNAPARQARAAAAAVQAGPGHQHAADRLPRNHHHPRRRPLPPQETKRRRGPVR
jgi:hypothetical protein